MNKSHFYSMAFAVSISLSGCVTATGLFDPEIKAAKQELADLQTQLAMLQNKGKSDGVPTKEIKETEAEIKAATDKLEDLETAHRMQNRGNAD